ncbi:MAG: DUF4238 domain-containing protein [Actinomycetota bacterium]|nr:DUF4238 domain-containing protein [Actinomycetota bacterium]
MALPATLLSITNDWSALGHKGHTPLPDSVLMTHGHEDVEAGVAALYEAARKNEKSAPRKHHLVPASYLARWATNDRIRMTFTADKKSVLTAPAKAARETDFYSLAGDGIDPDDVPPLLLETVLSHVEGEGKSLIDVLLREGPRGLGAEDAVHMATYLGFQMTRGRSFRLQAASLTNQALLLTVDGLTDEGIERRFQAQGREATPAAMAETRQALDAWKTGDFKAQPERAELAGLSAKFAVDLGLWFLGRSWRIYRSGRSLITSDDPVVPIPGPWQDRRRQPGFSTAGAIVFPLDPHHLLAMFHPYLKLDSLGLRPKLTAAEVDEINLALAAASDRWLFEEPTGRSTPSFDLPPWPTDRTTLTEVAEDLFDHHRPTRWHGTPKPPPPPVSRWWRNARGPGLHLRPFTLDALPHAMYDEFG